MIVVDRVVDTLEEYHAAVAEWQALVRATCVPFTLGASQAVESGEGTVMAHGYEDFVKCTHSYVIRTSFPIARELVFDGVYDDLTEELLDVGRAIQVPEGTYISHIFYRDHPETGKRYVSFQGRMSDDDAVALLLKTSGNGIKVRRVDAPYDYDLHD